MGYLNNIEKLGNKYIRKPKVKFSFGDNEVRVMQRLGFDIKVDENGTLEREGIDGELIQSLNKEQSDSLIKAIEKVHHLRKHSISTHDGFLYKKHFDKLTSEQQKTFNKLAAKYYGKDLVVSHNDINFQNMLGDDEKIILIDYEGANLNHPYFDYVQFYIAEGIKLRDDLDETIGNEILVLSLLYFILGTYEAPQVEDVFNGREKYLKLLSENTK